MLKFSLDLLHYRLLPRRIDRNFAGRLQCTSTQQMMSGSGSSQTCVARCLNSAWTYYTTVCCPAGSTETSKGIYTCTNNQQMMSGSGSSQTCVARCSNSAWTYYNTVCCPAGATETSKGVCTCSSSQQAITGSGTSAQCTLLCGKSITASLDCR